MPYTINKYNGAQITVVADGTIDNTLDIKLIGKNYAGYGEVQNENLVFMLEHFANATPPGRPVTGQIWFDSGTGKLKFYDGIKFRTTGGAETGVSSPTGLTTGDFWFDTGNKQLYTFDGSQFILVGPQGVAGSGTTQMKSRSVRDSLGASHAIIEAILNNVTVFIISPDADFTLDNSVNAITGFTKIRQGVTLCYTNNDSQLGQTTSSHRFWGTASNADRLGGFDVGSFVRAGTGSFSSVVQFADVGYTVGIPNARLAVFNENAQVPVIRNQLSDTIKFQTTVSQVTRTPLQLVGNDVLPGLNNISDIGADLNRFKTIYAGTFNGTATQADALNVSGTYRTASIASSPSTVVVRTTTQETINTVSIPAGSIKAEFFVGTATSANYADLAEVYETDKEYEVGTVIAIGGKKEATAAQSGDKAIGVISENPAYLMNAEAKGQPVALKGRVPVKVRGEVKKGDRLIADKDGTAYALGNSHPDMFGIALESSTKESVKLIEAVIL